MRKLTIALFLFSFTFLSCTKKPAGKAVWIYTSIYKNVIADLDKLLKAKFPDVTFEWYQSGSENVAARVNAELSAGKSQADLILTSDPFWYAELKKAGHLMAYTSPLSTKIPAQFRDPDGAFVVVRLPVAVLAYNTIAVTKNKAPQSWSDLTRPEWKGRVSMGSPMESGTSMLVAAQLVRKEGWPYFEKMRKNDLLSAGGNSAVISRMETKERPVGIVLLENVLEAQKKGSPLQVVYPKEGTLLVPSPMAILSKTKNAELSKQVYDYFLTDEMQAAIVAGRMYSLTAPNGTPEGAKEVKEILASALEWSPSVLGELFDQRESIKKKFMETVLN